MISCADNPSGEACIRGQAVDDALKLALATGLGTHGLIIAVDAAAAGCLTNPVLCANEAGVFILEMLGAEAAPAGIALTGTAGLTAKLTKEQLVELATLQALKKEGGDVTPEMVSQVISGSASKEIPKGTVATGSTGKETSGQIDQVIPNGNGNLPIIRKGKLEYEPLAKPNEDEIRAGKQFSELGYDVTFKKESTQSCVRTQDLWVEGIGKVDVYTPQRPAVGEINLAKEQTKIIRAIEKKDTQTTAVLTQIDLSGREMEQMANRVWGKPSVKNINTLFFQDSSERIHRFDRPKKGN